jgi:hypothetical protein
MSAAIGSTTSAIPKAPVTNNTPVKVGRDADGDNDGSKPGEVENSARAQKPVSLGSIGTVINTKA